MLIANAISIFLLILALSYMPLNKKNIVEYLLKKTEARIIDIETAINNTQESANSESKSSMGDKYETSRAMAQNDIDMYKSQLMQGKRDLALIKSINLNTSYQAVNTGALVETSLGIFFIGISLGKIELENQTIMMISIESPIAQQMKGKMANEAFDFNKATILIKAVY